MHRRNMIVIAVALVGFASMLVLLRPKGRLGSHTHEGTFTGAFQKSSSSKLRRPATEFFDQTTMLRLVESAIRGDLAGVQSAIATGANVNLRGKQGVTPLILAQMNFSFTGFNLLLEAGADPNIFADNGDNAMTLAAVMPDSNYLQSALKHGGNLDGKDSHGRSPLMLSASHGRTDNARLLINRGANVNTNDVLGDSPLIHAMQAPHPQQGIVQLLLKQGARIGDCNLAGLTARDYAATFDDPKLLEWFTPP